MEKNINSQYLLKGKRSIKNAMKAIIKFKFANPSTIKT
jgi:hypothetical protein